jgi:hypothetical protein
MAIDVFMSVGRTSTPKQEAFVAAIEQYLRDNGLNPRCVGRTDFSSLQPLKFIEQLMGQCSGTIIIAFERVHIADGFDKRGSSNQKQITKQNVATVWNQIEAAIAYILGHPLMVIVENGLRSEGLLETGYDWYMQGMDMQASDLQTREFAGVFNDWKKRVEDYQKTGGKQKSKEVDPEKLTLGQILGALKPAQLWTLIITLVGAVSAIAATAFKLGGMLGGQP